MDNIYTYRVEIPGGKEAAVTPCADGYTVYIDSRLDDAHAIRAYQHELAHILHDDFDSDKTADQIEMERHKGE